ncbi:16514_t:CDS:2, partial [Gigaspora rosea]
LNDRKSRRSSTTPLNHKTWNYNILDPLDCLVDLTSNVTRSLFDLNNRKSRRSSTTPLNHKPWNYNILDPLGCLVDLTSIVYLMHRRWLVS